MAGKKNNSAILLYCAQNISPNLETLNKKAKSIQRRRNMEDIHDVRVSSRRVRTNSFDLSKTISRRKKSRYGSAT